MRLRCLLCVLCTVLSCCAGQQEMEEPRLTSEGVWELILAARIHVEAEGHLPEDLAQLNAFLKHSQFACDLSPFHSATFENDPTGALLITYTLKRLPHQDEDAERITGTSRTTTTLPPLEAPRIESARYNAGKKVVTIAVDDGFKLTVDGTPLPIDELTSYVWDAAPDVVVILFGPPLNYEDFSRILGAMPQGGRPLVVQLRSK